MSSDLRRAVEPFTGPGARRASFQLLTTLGALAVVMWAPHAALGRSALSVAALVLPAAGVLILRFHQHARLRARFVLRVAPAPALLQWVTGSIGLDHVHHVAPRIPNYRLQSCHGGNASFHRSLVVTFRSGMAAFRLALWDESRGRMRRFRDVAENSATPAGA